MSSPRSLSKHLRYISRDSATRDEDQGRVFSAQSDDIDRQSFAARAEDDRHHFRFIVSPEDGSELADPKSFVRGLVAKMEKDLDTRLDWVSAIHDNTDHPHAHIVVRGKRDDGRDLVIPRHYISHEIRARAEELVSLELGPQSQFEKDMKIARQTRVEYVTEIDRALEKMAGSDGMIPLAKTALRYLKVNEARLRKLQSLGLAEKTGAQSWRLEQDFTRSLKQIGERNDILKQLRNAIGDQGGRTLDASCTFAGAAGRAPITGKVLKTGMRGEMHDEAFAILDSIDGRVVAVSMDARTDLNMLKSGMVVTLAPPIFKAKPSDKTIAEIAKQNGGIYSPGLHQVSDPSASPSFIQSHVRRLEAMRRVHLLERHRDGNWIVPPDYQTQVRRYHERTFTNVSAELRVESWTDPASQIDAPGLTWLDSIPAPEAPLRGFGEDVRSAHLKRREFLKERGHLKPLENALSRASKEALKQAGIDHLARSLSKQLNKPYSPVPERGAIEGVYRHAVVRPEGKFAVIDRQRGFTIVPWKSVMERARGRAISGTVTGTSINWSIGRHKGISI